jgi:hypothetical protein
MQDEPGAASVYTHLMAMEVDVQRLELGDVVLIDSSPEGGQVEAVQVEAGQVEARVVRAIDRDDTTVRVTLHVEGSGNLVREWSLGEQVTLVSGP